MVTVKIFFFFWLLLLLLLLRSSSSSSSFNTAPLYCHRLRSFRLVVVVVVMSWLQGSNGNNSDRNNHQFARKRPVVLLVGQPRRSSRQLHLQQPHSVSSSTSTTTSTTKTSTPSSSKWNFNLHIVAFWNKCIISARFSQSDCLWADFDWRQQQHRKQRPRRRLDDDNVERTHKWKIT